LGEFEFVADAYIVADSCETLQKMAAAWTMIVESVVSS